MLMNVFGAITLLLGLLANHLCTKFGSQGEHVAGSTKVQTIEGLRGYLAFFVFIGHSAVWFHYNREGVWVAPERSFFSILGEDSVVFFFMITAFLFGGKIIDARERPINWRVLYLHRVLRIVPMYVLAVSLVLLVVGSASGWSLQQPLGDLLQALVGWASFGAWGFPDVNGFVQTRYVIAGVAWTLTYEWMFYLLLPVFALLMRRKLDAAALMALALGLLMLFHHHAQPRFVAPFVVGIGAAAFVRVPRLQRLGQHPLANVIATGCIVVQAMLFPTAYGPIPLILLSVAFCLIASGASLFGVLTSRASRTFGLPTYSMYLLHGALLYIVFRGVLGAANAKELSEWQHWTIVALVAPVLVAVSHLTYRQVELRFMSFAGKKPMPAVSQAVRPG